MRSPGESGARPRPRRAPADRGEGSVWPGSAVTVLATGIGIVGGNAPPPAAVVPSGGSHGGSPPPRPVGASLLRPNGPAGIRPVCSARSVRVVEQGVDKTLRGGGQHQRRIVNLPAPAEFDCIRTPWSSPCPNPRTPARTRKTPATTPRYAGPAPATTTLVPDAPGQYPGGLRSEDDPCLGLRRRPTGGACSFFIIPHRCDMVNTLVGDTGRFFCHSMRRGGGQAGGPPDDGPHWPPKPGGGPVGFAERSPA